jgi:hypothetical protein
MERGIGSFKVTGPGCLVGQLDFCWLVIVIVLSKVYIILFGDLSLSTIV